MGNKSRQKGPKPDYEIKSLHEERIRAYEVAVVLTSDRHASREFTAEQLNAQHKKIFDGKDIPFEEFLYPSLHAFLCDCPHFIPLAADNLFKVIHYHREESSPRVFDIPLHYPVVTAYIDLYPPPPPPPKPIVPAGRGGRLNVKQEVDEGYADGTARVNVKAEVVDPEYGDTGRIRVKTEPVDDGYQPKTRTVQVKREPEDSGFEEAANTSTPSSAANDADSPISENQVNEPTPFQSWNPEAFEEETITPASDDGPQLREQQQQELHQLENNEKNESIFFRLRNCITLLGGEATQGQMEKKYKELFDMAFMDDLLKSFGSTDMARFQVAAEGMVHLKRIGIGWFYFDWNHEKYNPEKKKKKSLQEEKEKEEEIANAIPVLGAPQNQPLQSAVLSVPSPVSFKYTTMDNRKVYINSDGSVSSILSTPTSATVSSTTVNFDDSDSGVIGPRQQPNEKKKEVTKKREKTPPRRSMRLQEKENSEKNLPKKLAEEKRDKGDERDWGPVRFPVNKTDEEIALMRKQLTIVTRLRQCLEMCRSEKMDEARIMKEYKILHRIGFKEDCQKEFGTTRIDELRRLITGDVHIEKDKGRASFIFCLRAKVVVQEVHNRKRSPDRSRDSSYFGRRTRYSPARSKRSPSRFSRSRRSPSRRSPNRRSPSRRRSRSPRMSSSRDTYPRSRRSPSRRRSRSRRSPSRRRSRAPRNSSSRDTCSGESSSSSSPSRIYKRRRGNRSPSRDSRRGDRARSRRKRSRSRSRSRCQSRMKRSGTTMSRRCRRSSSSSSR